MHTFTLTTRPPTEQEANRFGIFISHSSADKDKVEELCVKMREANLLPLQDGEFIQGGDNFFERIHDCIKCYGCVIIISKASLKSDWVAYECGYFSQSRNTVVLWDPDNLLSLNPNKPAPKEDPKATEKKKGLFEMLRHQKESAQEENPAEADDGYSALLNFHLTQYLPVCRTTDQVVDALKHLSVYADLYTNACQDYSVTDFQEDLSRNVATTMVSISSPELNGHGDLFKECKLSTLVVNFGMNYANQGDGIHCWAERDLDLETGKFVTTDDCLLKDGKCRYSGGKCTLYAEGKIDQHKKECVILNHIIPSGRYFDVKEPDYNKQITDCGTLLFYVPVHKVYGTEFKFIIDAPNQAKHAELMRLFTKMQLDPTISDSLNGWRIYLSIPDVPYEGLFRMEDDLFHNNFFCPRAASNPNDR